MTELLQPWIGRNYSRGTGLLIVSESTYCWKNDSGELIAPAHDHHSLVTVGYWALDNFGTKGNHYAAKLTRTICSKAYPSEAERHDAWNLVAYTSYVHRPMSSRYERPSDEDWKFGEQPFLALLDELRPSRVLVTGLTTWERMPFTQVEKTSRLQAYRRKSDNGLSWCLAVPHPSSRKVGDTFRWPQVATALKDFRERADLEAS